MDEKKVRTITFGKWASLFIILAIFFAGLFVRGAFANEVCYEIMPPTVFNDTEKWQCKPDQKLPDGSYQYYCLGVGKEAVVRIGVANGYPEFLGYAIVIDEQLYIVELVDGCYIQTFPAEKYVPKPKPKAERPKRSGVSEPDIS